MHNRCREWFSSLDVMSNVSGKPSPDTLKDDVRDAFLPTFGTECQQCPISNAIHPLGIGALEERHSRCRPIYMSEIPPPTHY